MVVESLESNKIDSKKIVVEMFIELPFFEPKNSPERP